MQPTNQSLPTNPEVQRAHQRQFWLQILLPIILGTLVLIGAGALASFSPGERPTIWANISIILMVIILIGGGIGSFLVILAGIMGSDWLLKKIPYYSYIAQIYIAYYGKKIQEASTASAQPMVETRSIFAAVKRFFNLSKRN